MNRREQSYVTKLVVLVFAIAHATAFAQRPEKPPTLDVSKPLGSFENPVRVFMPAGQKYYISRLRCSDGETPRYERVGSAGRGPYGNVVDVYDLRCQTGEPFSIVFDMYHKDYVEARPVSGFTLLER